MTPFRPRPYQTACKAAVFDTLARAPSALVSMATGLGKTEIYLDVALDWPGRVMVMAHRDFLVRQPVERLARRGYDGVAVEMAGERADGGGFRGPPKLVFTSVQTMCRPKRHRRFDPADFGLLIIDEAHHAVAQTYRNVVRHFSQNEGLRLLGLTATPKRADDLALGQVFDSVAYEYGIESAITDGWLVPVRQRAVKVEGLDFSRVRSLAGDFNEADLERVLTEEKPLHEVAAAAVAEAGDLPTLVFCCTVNHARLLCAVLNRYKRGSAAYLHGGSDPDERARTLAAYKAGAVQFLCNCMLFTEGFDAPATACVVMARPTKSLALYAQVLGRGTRPLPGVVDEYAEGTPGQRQAAIRASRKPSMVALDFVGNSGRHQIVTAADLLGGKYGAPVRAYATKTLAEEDRPAPVEEALERAADELDFAGALEAWRRVITARANYRAVDVNPFGGTAAPAAPAAGPRYGVPATEGQVDFLATLGVPRATAAGYTKNQAGAVIGNLLAKRKGRGA